ncbi:MAG: 50S ribosomal protein L23 [Patescibacteria group bacterium]|nr:50S ribosomal protein L23 [Patescibacteria group bacterium]
MLVRPLITEKAANLGSEDKYVFAVNKNANKIEIAKAINEVYGIKPIAVNIVRVGGKKVRHGRVQGRRKDWKKAIVTLPKGKTINIYEGV